MNTIVKLLFSKHPADRDIALELLNLHPEMREDFIKLRSYLGYRPRNNPNQERLSEYLDIDIDQVFQCLRYSFKRLDPVISDEEATQITNKILQW